MAGDNQQFCLRWNNHQSTLISVFDSLLESGTLVDCTLAAEGQYLKAHKVVLSACSPYLEALLSQHYEKHPIVILKDVKFQELKSMMDYMYRGEVNITQDQLATFLKAAESLQIKGLSESSGGDDARDVGSTAKRPREEPPPRRPVNPHPQARLPHSSGLTIEPRRSIPHSSEMAPESPMKSREGSTSPVARKRRRRRPSTGEDASNAALSDSQLETSNSCDLPPISNQAQSTPISVPSILATPSASNNQPIESDQPLETDAMNRFPNTPGGELMVKTKMEPNTDQLIEPKTEYLDDINNEDSVEDLTLDDDDEMPGPSHADGSNQNFSQWQMSGDRSTDEVFMAAQEAVGAHRDSQGPKQMVSVTELHAWHKPVNIPSLKHCENLTDLLIHIVTKPEYLSKLKDKSSRKKNVWLAVAKELEKLGYPLSTESDLIAAEKCNQKLRNLKKTYHKFLKDSLHGFRDCGKVTVPKYLAELPKLFGENPDDMYRGLGGEITFMETSDVSRLVEPRDLVESVTHRKLKKKLPTIIILKPGKRGDNNTQSFIYPATSDHFASETGEADNTDAEDSQYSE